MYKKYIKIEWDNFLKLEMEYDIGWFSYFSGSSRPRGYYLYIRVVELTKYANGCTSERYAMFGQAQDFKILLEEVKRRTAKQEQNWTDKVTWVFSLYPESDIVQAYKDGRRDFFTSHFWQKQEA